MACHARPRAGVVSIDRSIDRSIYYCYPLTRQDLLDRHLLVLIRVAHGAGRGWTHVLAEPKGLRAVRGARVRAAHVLIDLV